MQSTFLDCLCLERADAVQPQAWFAQSDRRKPGCGAVHRLRPGDLGVHTRRGCAHIVSCTRPLEFGVVHLPRHALALLSIGTRYEAHQTVRRAVQLLPYHVLRFRGLPYLDTYGKYSQMTTKSHGPSEGRESMSVVG